MNRGAIWTQPKILAVELITIINLFIIFQNWESINLSKVWKIVTLLWSVFLIIGLITTIYSPLPVRSLLGHVTMKSGLLYYGLIAVFTMSNALVLKLKPEIGKAQLQGLLIGGLILSISIFPQMIDWRIDYTATSGQLIRDNILKSTIFQGHQPIGLYSHRGHAAFTLAAVNVMALVAYQKKWINIKQLALYIIPAMPALIFTQTRAGLLALIIAFGYLLGKKHYKVIAVGAIIFILIISLFSANRKIESLPIISQLTSDRVDLWQKSYRRIKMRPLLGWGFDGFEIAYPYTSRGIRMEPSPTSKGHNLVLDTVLSVGIIGTVVYLVLIGFCLYLVQKSSMAGMLAVAIAYLTYTFTWYECAQFTHIFWWSLSLFDYENIFSNTSLNSYHSAISNGTMDTRIRGWISRAKARIFK